MLYCCLENIISHLQSFLHRWTQPDHTSIPLDREARPFLFTFVPLECVVSPAPFQREHRRILQPISRIANIPHEHLHPETPLAISLPTLLRM